jgi:adenylate kinase
LGFSGGGEQTGMRHLILLGPPGAGKGTQGTQLAERLEIPKIATGDILRAAVREGSELGKQAKAFMVAGELVPDDLILGLVRGALGQSVASRGAIFDGFPRNVPQARSLDEILSQLGRELDAVIVLEVPDEVIVERMSGRRTDPESGEVYHLRYNPPPPEIADRVVQRPDDREETVRHRLAVYAAQTAPLISHYEEVGVPIIRIDGTKPIDRVQQEILQRLAP